MISLINRLITGRDRLTQLAHASDRSAFATAFVVSDVFFLSTPFPEGLDPATMTQEEFLAMTASAAQHTAENLGENTSGFPPFVYQNQGDAVLPIFSSRTAATEFAKAYCKAMDRVIPFQLLGQQGANLADLLLAVPKVILNPECKHSYELSGEDIRLINAKALS